MNFIFVYADRDGEANTSIFRMIRPAHAIAKTKKHGVILLPIESFEKHNKEIEDACNNANIIVIERNLFGDVLTKALYYKVRQKIIVANFDDGYHAIQPENITYDFWKNGHIKGVENGVEKTLTAYPHPYDQFTWGLRQSHFCLVPSKELVKYYNQFAPVYCLPNYFNVEEYINFQDPNNEDIIIGNGSSMSHVESWRNSNILEAIKNVVDIRPNVKIKICGDRRILDMIPISDDRKIFQPYVNHIQWPAIVNTFDIGVAPLAGEYDKYRSIIKPVEYCLTKKPWVASDGPAYHEIAEYGTLVKNTVPEWTISLLNKIDNLSEEREKAKGKPYQFGLTFDVDLNVNHIIDMYRQLSRIHAHLEFLDQP